MFPLTKVVHCVRLIKSLFISYCCRPSECHPPQTWDSSPPFHQPEKNISFQILSTYCRFVTISQFWFSQQKVRGQNLDWEDLDGNGFSAPPPRNWTWYSPCLNNLTILIPMVDPKECRPEELCSCLHLTVREFVIQICCNY